MPAQTQFRRQLLLLYLALAAFLSAGCVGPLLAQPRLAVEPQQYGASGHDEADDTAALQAAVNAAAASDREVRVPAGVYMVNANANPATGTFGGISLPSGTRLRFEDGAVLQALPSRHGQYAVLRIEDAQDITIEGRGVIRGERYEHQGSTGEWGMGILIFGGRRIRISDVLVQSLWGDGVYVGRSARRYSEDIELRNVRARDNRRQGISVVSARRVRIINPDIRLTHGTPPSAGIDLEPDDPTFPNVDVAIEGGYFEGNAIDVLMVNGNRRIRIMGSKMRSLNGIVIRDGSDDVRISGVDVQVPVAQKGTSALQVIARNPASVRNVEIRGSLLRGGEVALRIPYRTVGHIRVVENEIMPARGKTPYRVDAEQLEWNRNRVTSGQAL